MRGIEYIGGLNAQFQSARFPNGDGFAQVHVKSDLARTLNDISPGIAE